MVLVGEQHDVAVAQAADALLAVVDARAQAEDLLERGDLGVGLDLGRGRVAHVEQLAAQREHAVDVAPDLGQPRDGHRLGRVALGQDERAQVRVLGPRAVGVVELRHDDPVLFFAVGLGQLLVVHELGELEHAVHQPRLGHLLDEVVGQRALGAELGLRRRERLLGLRVEARVDDGRVDEEEQVVAHDLRLDGALLDARDQLVDDLVGDVVDVRPAPRGDRSVDERDLAHAAVGLVVRRDDLPSAVRRRKVGAVVVALGPEEQVGVRLKALDGQPVAVEADGDVAVEAGGEVVRALAEELEDVVGDALELEAREVGTEGDGRVRVLFGGDRLDLGLVDARHVVADALRVQLAAVRVERLDGEFR